MEGIGSQGRRYAVRHPGASDRVVVAGGVRIGGATPPVWMAGPCAVESFEQLDRVGAVLQSLGIPVLRGGAFKPRTSPYAFQGLGEAGLRILREVGRKYGLAVVTEVLATRDLPRVCEAADILQIGARNMFNTDLLRAAGESGKPILLKRGMMATIEEFLFAAEYACLGGAREIILCERGIRTFETATRNTLDIAAVPILKKETPFPVVVDVSHALGRTDILAPIIQAVLAAGANGVMLEVHPDPGSARSDAAQQLPLEALSPLYQETKIPERH